MRLVLRQIVVDDDRFRRAVEVVLDVVDFGDFGQLRDVESAVLEGEAVRPVEAGVERLDLAFAVLLDDRVNLVEQPAADEHRALVAFSDRARIADARRVELDLETLGCGELVDRQLVGGGRDRRRGDRGEVRLNRRVGPTLRPGRRRGRRGRRDRRSRRRLLCSRGPSSKRCDDGSGKQCSPPRNVPDHVALPGAEPR